VRDEHHRQGKSGEAVAQNWGIFGLLSSGPRLPPREADLAVVCFPEASHDFTRGRTDQQFGHHFYQDFYLNAAPTRTTEAQT
jgi:hypothetical protein